MAGLLDGLESLGLGNLQNVDIYADEKNEKKGADGTDQEVGPPPEEDYIYDKEFQCPVCDMKFTAKVMKSGKAKLLGTDPDMRPRFENIDSSKYDVLLCDKCGYASLVRYHGHLLPTQIKLIRENISQNVKLKKYNDPTYSYDEAFERYKLALANAVVKKCKISERAFICLKTAWLLRGKKESLEAENKLTPELKQETEAMEKEYLKNAYAGFIEARSKEAPPIAGMDSMTLDYLLAQLGYMVGDYSASLKMVGSILTTRGGNERIKKKALELKDELKTAMAANKQ